MTADTPKAFPLSSLRAWSLPVGLLIFSLLLPLAPTVYSQWIHGWGDSCQATDRIDTPSPSGTWIARDRHVDCSVLAGGVTEEVVLLQTHPLFPFLAREKMVFSKDVSSPQEDRIFLQIRWMDDKNISLTTPACPKGCILTADEAASLCQSPCKLNAQMGDIHISLTRP
jgi:hypothetical protein